MMREVGISSQPELFFLFNDFRFSYISLADVSLNLKWQYFGFTFSFRLEFSWFFQIGFEIEGRAACTLFPISVKNLQKPLAMVFFSGVKLPSTLSSLAGTSFAA